VIHFFWDRILGTYRSPDAGQTQASRRTLSDFHLWALATLCV
jgi:sterol desaturase/sphingolipid hydroxylase (fatty acid hydroxylase superfamily)